jgi:hypothetical protein
LLLLLKLSHCNFAFISFYMRTSSSAWCTVHQEIKAKLHWDSFSNNSNSTWWWPSVAETYCTRVKTDEQSYIEDCNIECKRSWMQQDAEIYYLAMFSQRHRI